PARVPTDAGDAAPLLAGHPDPRDRGRAPAGPGGGPPFPRPPPPPGRAPDPGRGWAAAAVRLVLSGFPDQAEDFEAWPMAARLLPHALAATDHAEGLGVDPIATARPLHHAGRYLWSRAEYTQAKALHQRALSIREAEFGPDHPDTARSLHNLANVLYPHGHLHDPRTLS